MTSSQSISIFDVAHYFLYKSIPNTRYSMTHKKLQKICYFAQGFHLAQEGKPLFHEEVCAWFRGPVSPVLYEAYKVNDCFEIEPVKELPSIFQEHPASLQMLEDIWNAYGKFDGSFLEVLTHIEKPWIMARKQLKHPEDLHSVITHESMRQSFQEQLEDANQQYNFK